MRRGISLINRNWQLVLVKVLLLGFNFIAAMIFIFIPMVVMIMTVSGSMSQVGNGPWPSNLIEGIMTHVINFLPALILVALCFAAYLTIAMALSVFSLAASAGIMASAIRDDTFKFTFAEFMLHGKRLFWPFMRFTIIFSLAAIAALSCLAIIGGAIAATLGAVELQHDRLTVFMGALSTFVLIFMGTGILFVLYGTGLQGMAHMTLENRGAVESIKRAWDYLNRNTPAVKLIAAMFGGYLVIQAGVVLVSLIIGLVPVLGALLINGVSLASSVLNMYLGLCIIATMLSYYSMDASQDDEDMLDIADAMAEEELEFLSGIGGPSLSEPELSGYDLDKPGLNKPGMDGP